MYQAVNVYTNEKPNEEEVNGKIKNLPYGSWDQKATGNMTLTRILHQPVNTYLE
jgi:hypothetical protein